VELCAWRAGGAGRGSSATDGRRRRRKAGAEEMNDVDAGRDRATPPASVSRRMRMITLGG
jgi:hypothetical protein